MSEQHDRKDAAQPRDAVAGVDDPAIPNVKGEEAQLAIGGFRLVERILLILVALMTLGAAAIEIWVVYENWTITLADILLMFLYTEVIGMVAVFYTGRGSPFVYPIFIAITALARLIVLQGKDMAPENIVYEAGAILLLALAAVIIVRAGGKG
jgi:protein PsiE